MVNTAQVWRGQCISKHNFDSDQAGRESRLGEFIVGAATPGVGDLLQQVQSYQTPEESETYTYMYSWMPSMALIRLNHWENTAMSSGGLYFYMSVLLQTTAQPAASLNT